jgi:hypothetical protein
MPWRKKEKEASASTAAVHAEKEKLWKNEQSARLFSRSRSFSLKAITLLHYCS